MREREPTRTREHGTKVTNPADYQDPGLARILALRRIVNERQYAKIDGKMIDLFTASAIVTVYDALNEANQKRFRDLKVWSMAKIAFQFTG